MLSRSRSLLLLLGPAARAVDWNSPPLVEGERRAQWPGMRCRGTAHLAGRRRRCRLAGWCIRIAPRLSGFPRSQVRLIPLERIVVHVEDTQVAGALAAIFGSGANGCHRPRIVLFSWHGSGRGNARYRRSALIRKSQTLPNETTRSARNSAGSGLTLEVAAARKALLTESI